MELLARARRRFRNHLIVEEAIRSLCAALAGAILLLLAGTRILDWYWVALLIAASAALGYRRVVRRRPADYPVAQLLDGRLNLHDTLSTACYFLQPPADRRASEGFRQAQHHVAEQLSAQVDVRSAMPWMTPRSVYVAAALAAVAVGLFMLRFGSGRSLDLRPPLVQAVVDFFTASPVLTARNKSLAPRPGEEMTGIAVDPAGERTGELDPAPDSVLQTVDTPDVGGEPRDEAGKSPHRAEAPTGDPLEGSENSERSAGDGREGRPEDPTPRSGNPQDSPEPGQSANQQGENSSLMEKLRDAMANLLSRMKLPQKTSDGGRTASSNRPGTPSNAMQRAADQKGSKTSGAPQSEGAPGEDSEGEPQSEGQQQAQAGQGKSGDRTSEQSGRNDPRSGMGKQDGSKELKDAEMLAAMGKISEILGKRNANITGEIMVEVTGGKQQPLKTPYSQRGATHRESGGEIHRDEIPLALQDYVQRYFEEVRKPAAPAAPAAPKPR